MLAIESSQCGGGIALRDRAGNVFVEPFAELKRHDDDLLPAIDRLCGSASVRPRDLSVLAVSIGPGGFTGLRIAVSTAKMLAETLGITLVAVPSALVAAASSLRDDPEARQALVLLAGKGETAWATWCGRANEQTDDWRIDGEPMLIDEHDKRLNERAPGMCLVADVHQPAAILARGRAAGARMLPLSLAPAMCLLLGERMLREGKTTDPLELLPLYPREPEAVSRWRERAATGA